MNRMEREPFGSARGDPTGRRASRRGCAALLCSLALVLVAVVAWLVWSGIEFETVTPTSQAVVGTWRGPDGATIVFTQDGRFSGWPNDDPADAGGTWRIGRNLGDDTTGVVLSFDGGGTDVLYARGSRSHPTLFYYLDDPDTNRRYEFKKQD
jgi:hypothetical protein